MRLNFWPIIFAGLLFVGGAWWLGSVGSPKLVVTTQVAAVVETPPPKAGPKLKLMNGALPAGLTARAFLSALVDARGQVTVLVAKNNSAVWPIASLTKLFTAVVVSDYYDLSATVKVGDKFFVTKDLFYPLLIESNNEIALALADRVGQDTFVGLLNTKARDLQLTHTYFANVTGLDLSPSTAANYSTADDLLSFARWLILHHPELIDITHLKEYPLRALDGTLDHQVKTTNKLLDYNAWPASPAGRPAEVWGGKTGQTDLAKQNLLLILRDTKTNNLLVNIVLGADDNFADMEALLKWVYNA